MKSKKKSQKGITKSSRSILADDRAHLGRKKEDVIFPIAVSASVMSKSYISFLSGLKKRIQEERLRVVLASNSALVNLYWEIGSGILKKQKEEGWGAKVIDRLSVDLRREFTDMKGFSPRNLKYMRSFAAVWPDRTIVQRVIAQIPWRSNIALMDKLEKPEERLWYAMRTIPAFFVGTRSRVCVCRPAGTP